MPPAVVISHPRVGAELGLLGTWLDKHGFAVERRTRDDVLPADCADDADLLIILGSVWTMTRPMDAPDDPPQAAAAIAAEEDVVRRRMAQQRPLLGICFGGQVLSHALGGEVRRQPAAHVAWEVPDSSIAELRQPWMLLHEDAFTLPPGAELLAEADHAPVAYRVGRAWGVQFHPEVDAGILERMFVDIDYNPERSRPYVDQARLRADDLERQSHALFDRFWSEVGA
ncbi:MAG: type 1 glutamine amidotransferase [bacterium]